MWEGTCFPSVCLLVSLVPLSFPSVSVSAYGFSLSMQMSETTLIWPPVSRYYGNNIKTTKCLKRSTFIPASLWSSQEISIPANRRAHRGKQLCIWMAMLAAWTKMWGFEGWRGLLGKWVGEIEQKKGNNHEEKKKENQPVFVRESLTHNSHC